jgi:hypothetical protein
MYAIESTNVWDKFVVAVDLLTVLGRTSVAMGCYGTHVDCRWCLNDLQHYEQFVEASRTYSNTAKLALEGAARNLLTKEGVDTVFALAVKSVETRIDGLDFLIEMQGDLRGPVEDKKLLEKALCKARAWE